MLIAIVVAAVGVGMVTLGVKGFTSDGIPWTLDERLTGTSGRIVGMICLLIGSPAALVGIWLMLRVAGGP